MARSKSRNFAVQMYKSEYRRIQAWVDKYQNLETGGDLFGLWADDHTAVVQLVLGPGEECRRTGASFYQDVPYLERVGNVLTNKEGLCHIGEWHSHHRIGLRRPSGGDENTVWTNMDRYGIYRFFLFIATIEGDYFYKRRASGSFPNDVKIRCFLFETDDATKRKPVLEGEINFLSEEAQDSPFRLNPELAKDFERGAESKSKVSLQDMKKFELTGKDSQEHVKNQNKIIKNKETVNSHTGPRRSSLNKKSSSGKKTYKSSINIVLSNQKELKNKEGK